MKGPTSDRDGGAGSEVRRSREKNVVGGLRPTMPTVREALLSAPLTSGMVASHKWHF
jgi:hypothetical protein